MKRRFVIVICLIVVLSLNVSAETKVYRGLLHAHTMFSDGSGTPDEAFVRAKQHVDFFAVTPHNHPAAEQGAKDRSDKIVVANNPSLFDFPNSITIHPEVGDTVSTITVKSLLTAVKDNTSTSFIPIAGQEVSTISSGNHVCVFNYDKQISVTDAANGNFKALLELMDVQAATGIQPIIQLNHPNIQKDFYYGGSNSSTINEMHNDYGIDEFQDFSSLVNASDKYIHLIEMFSGVAMKKARSNKKVHDHENDYFFYLSQGFHISPSVGHDNHYKTWGDTNDTRMGVYSTALSKDKLFEGMRNNRTFASSDLNLSVSIVLKHGSTQVVNMGENVNLDVDTDCTLEVTVEDEDGEKDFIVQLFNGQVMPLSRLNKHPKPMPTDFLLATISVTDTDIVTFTDLLALGMPEFLYVKIIQDDNDEAWSAPIWINHPKNYGVNFVWTSKASKYYHKEGCRYAKSMKPENKIIGSNPPSDRKLHACVIKQEEGH